MHWIQVYILEQLSRHAERRNRDLRPPKVESNLFQYHLSRVVALGFVEQAGIKYRLAPAGLFWADRYSVDLKQTRLQPKIITVIGAHDPTGRFVLIGKKLQPFVGSLYVPSGKIRLDESLQEAALRESQEKLGFVLPGLQRAGTVRMTIEQSGQVVSDFVGLLFRAPLPRVYTLPAGAVLLAPDEVTDSAAYMPGTSELLETIAALRPVADFRIQCGR